MMNLVKEVKNLGIGRREAIIGAIALLVITMFKPLGTQSIYGDTAVKIGSSVGATILEMLKDFVMQNVIIFTIIVFLLIFGFVFLPKKARY